MMTIHINPIIDPVSLKKNEGETGQAAIDTRREAWQRAMEKEQASNWLQHGLIERDRFVALGQNRQNVLVSPDTQHQDTTMKKLTHLSIFMSNKNLRDSNYADSYGFDGRFEGIDVKEREPLSEQESLKSVWSPSAENSKNGQLEHNNAMPAEVADFDWQSSTENMRKTADFDSINPAQDISLEEGALTNPHQSQMVNSDFVQAHSVPAATLDHAGLQQNLLKLMAQLGVDASIVQESSSVKSLASKPELNYSVKIQAGISASFNESLSASPLEIQLDQSEQPQTRPQEKTQLLQRESLRFHTQLSDEGVKIWLGVDADSTLDLAMLSLTLRSWLNQQGIQLYALICNGRPLLQREQGATLKQFDVKEQQGFDSLLADRVKNLPIQTAVNLNFKRMETL